MYTVTNFVMVTREFDGLLSCLSLTALQLIQSIPMNPTFERNVQTGPGCNDINHTQRKLEKEIVTGLVLLKNPF